MQCGTHAHAHICLPRSNSIYKYKIIAWLSKYKSEVMYVRVCTTNPTKNVKSINFLYDKRVFENAAKKRRGKAFEIHAYIHPCIGIRKSFRKPIVCASSFLQVFFKNIFSFATKNMYTNQSSLFSTVYASSKMPRRFKFNRQSSSMQMQMHKQKQEIKMQIMAGVQVIQVPMIMPEITKQSKSKSKPQANSIPKSISCCPSSSGSSCDPRIESKSKSISLSARD